MFRWFALTALVGCFSISAFYRRRARLESETIQRRREGGRFLLARGLGALPLFLTVVTYVVDPRRMAWASFAPPTWVRWVGVVVGLLAVPAAYWVFSSLGRSVSETVLTKQHHELVMRGPYRWIRHPLYTTGIALFLAIGLMAANWFILLFAFIALASIRFVVVPLEERELVAKFGDEYRRYMQRTGGMLPRM